MWVVIVVISVDVFWSFVRNLILIGNLFCLPHFSFLVEIFELDFVAHFYRNGAPNLLLSSGCQDLSDFGVPLFLLKIPNLVVRCTLIKRRELTLFIDKL